MELIIDGKKFYGKLDKYLCLIIPINSKEEYKFFREWYDSRDSTPCLKKTILKDIEFDWGNTFGHLYDCFPLINEDKLYAKIIYGKKKTISKINNIEIEDYGFKINN